MRRRELDYRNPPDYGREALRIAGMAMAMMESRGIRNNRIMSMRRNHMSKNAVTITVFYCEGSSVRVSLKRDHRKQWVQSHVRVRYRAYPNKPKLLQIKRTQQWIASSFAEKFNRFTIFRELAYG